MVTCRICGTELAVAGRGRPPRYCSRACRSKAYRQRVARSETSQSDSAQSDSALSGPALSRTGPGEAGPERERVDIAEDGSTETLTTTRVVQAAIALADQEGAAGLSMRAVAARLNTGAMSLYRYVAGREELVDLMTDTVFGDRPLPEDDDGTAGWREKLELSARSEWEIYREHSWVPQVAALITRPPAGVNVMAYTDYRMRALRGHGLEFPVMMQSAILVSAFVQSVGLSLSHEHQAGRRGELSRREWLDARQPVIDRHLRSRHLPMVSQFGERTYQASEPDAVFEFGLHRVLDGIGLLVTA